MPRKGTGAKPRSNSRAAKRQAELEIAKEKHSANVALEKADSEARNPPQIGAEKYNAMWKAYCEQPSINHVSKVAGVTPDTARKYILGPGAPGHGMPPIRQRYLESMASMQEQQERSLIEFQKETVGDVSNVLSLHIGEFGIIQKAINSRLEEYEEKKRAAKAQGVAPPPPESMVSIDKLAASYDKMVRLMEHLMGQADLTIEAKEKSRFAGWSTEEKMAYATKGIIPERAREQS